MNPEISIIVPVYNVENYLKDCIESIINQTFNNFELILINDGSTDKSGEICDEYSKLDTRIKAIHTEYKGVSSARNIGISIAKSMYIGFVDSDDYIDKDMYKTLYDLCIDNGCDISICKLGREIDGKLINNEKVEYIKILNNEEGICQLFKGILYRFSLCNKLFNRNCFKNITFPEGRIHEDLSTTYKLFANSNKIIYTSYIGYMYVKRNNSILTKKYDHKRLDAFIGWNEIIEFINDRYPMLKEIVYASYTYACIDHMYYILNQVQYNDEKKELLFLIRQNIKDHYRYILSNKILTIKYKFLISMLNYNSNLIVNLNSLKGK